MYDCVVRLNQLGYIYMQDVIISLCNLNNDKKKEYAMFNFWAHRFNIKLENTGQLCNHWT